MKLQRLAQAELDRMSPAEKDALILQLFEALERLQRRVEALEGQVKKNSRNSSKPPAQPRRRGERRMKPAANRSVPPRSRLLTKAGCA